MERTDIAVYLPVDIAQHLMEEGSQSEIGEEELRERYGLAEAESTTDGTHRSLRRQQPRSAGEAADLHGS